MRRVLAIFTALAVVLALATPASAKRDKPPKPPTEGQTCQQSGDAETGDLDLVMSAAMSEACIDWIPTPGTWQVVVTTGTARSVAFNVKDSVPGDYCFDYTRTSEGGTWTFVLSQVNGSWMDACGDIFSDSNEPLAFQVFSQWKGRQSGEPATVTATFMG